MKSAIDLHGTNLQELPKEYGWSPSNGYHTIRQWKGTQTEIENLLPALRTDGYEYQVKEGPLWSCIAKIEQDTSGGSPAVEVPIPQFEIVVNKREVDLLDSNSQWVQFITPEQRRIIKEAVQNADSFDFLISRNNAFSAATSDQKQIAASVALHYNAGQRTLVEFLPVLRKTYNASNTYVVNESISDVGRIFTTAQLIAAENVPSTIRGILPVETAPNNNVNIPLTAGWLKGHPTYNQIGRNQFQVNVEYEYNWWSYYMYDAA